MNVLDRFAQKILHRIHKAVLIVAVGADGSVRATVKGDPESITLLQKLYKEEKEGGNQDD